MLNPRQEQILNFIVNYSQPYLPTVREIGAGVGLSSSSTVQHYLNDLEVMGYIERKANSPRSLVVKKVVSSNG